MSERVGHSASLLLATLFLLLGGATAFGQEHDELLELFSQVDTVELEETESVLNVIYNVDLDGDNGFFVSDQREGQFRRYDRNGALVWAFGRRGRGPNEFRSAIKAVRLEGEVSRVALLERQGKVAVYDEVGDSLVSTAVSQLIRISDATWARDGSVWVATGVSEGTDGDRIFHRVNAYTGAVDGSIASPPIAAETRREALYMNWSAVGRDPESDTLWAVIATRDTIYALDGHAQQVVRRIPIASELVRPLTKASDEEFGDPVARREWAEKQSYLTDVFPLSNGRIAVLFQDFRNSLPVWGLVVTDRDGEVLFQAHDTHRLLTADPAQDLLVFQDRNDLEGNRWLIGKLR